MNVKLEKNNKYISAEQVDNLMKSCQEDVFDLVKNIGIAKQKFEESKIQNEGETRKILLGFLSIADSFKSRFDELELKKKGLTEETLSWISKFNITYKKLLNTIRECGITPIVVAPGEIYNAELHNAIEVEEHSDKKDGTILQEIYQGYFWHGKVLRPSDVKLSRSKKQ